jgi:hypothetical protein
VPVRHEIDIERGLARVLYEGRCTVQELAATSEALLRDPDYQHVTRQLADLSACTAFDVPAEELRDLAHHVSVADQRAAVRLAVVAPQEVMFGMARLYAAHREPSPMEVRVFRDRAEALAWLGLDPREPDAR